MAPLSNQGNQLQRPGRQQSYPLAPSAELIKQEKRLFNIR